MCDDDNSQVITHMCRETESYSVAHHLTWPKKGQIVICHQAEVLRDEELWGEGAIRQRNFDVGTVANCIQVVGTICGNVILCHNKTVNCVCVFISNLYRCTT